MILGKQKEPSNHSVKGWGEPDGRGGVGEGAG